MIRYALPLLLSACASASATEWPVAEPDVQSELAALIDRTRDLPSLHATYEIEAADQVEGTAEILYRSPGFMHLRLLAQDGSAEMVSTGEAVYSRMTLGGADGAWHRIEIATDTAASRMLDELFPGASNEPRSLFLGVSIEDDASEEGANIEVSQSFARGPRTPLGWLESMKRRPADVAVDGSSFVWSGTYFRGVVSRASGMLESLVATTKRGTYELRLRECSFGEIAPERTAVPAEALRAELDADASQDCESTLRWMLRWEVFEKAQGCIDSGRRPWNDATRADLRSVLVALHGEEIDARYAGWKGNLQDNLEAVTAWIRDQRANEDSAARMPELEEEARDRRGKLEAILESARAKHVESMPPARLEKLALGEEFSRLEREVVDELWSERMTRPVLADFDAEIALALGR